MKKHFVLDTNVLINDPKAIYAFEDNHVIITSTVQQELDKKKSEFGDVGYNARTAIAEIDHLRKQGDLLKGVKLPNGGTLSLEPDGINQDYLPNGFNIAVNDNKIISTCIYLNKRRYKANHVVLVTEDANMRISASVCGVSTEEYKNLLVPEEDYTGVTTREVSSELINRLYVNGVMPEKNAAEGLLENEFVTLKSETGQSAMTVYRGGNFNLIQERGLFHNKINPLNARQTYALWALLQPADKIPLVILLGAPGSAKTFLSLAAGLAALDSVGNDTMIKYDKLMLTRPSAGSYENLGYLPGDLEEKLSPLYASYYDNYDVINKLVKNLPKIDDLKNEKKIEIGSLDFIRGRSINNTYLICDEVQNASRTLVRDIVTRAGKNTKIVLCGDPNQIDAKNLNTRNNGLVFAASRMKGDDECAIISFTSHETVRSKLSKVASEKMKD